MSALAKLRLSPTEYLTAERRARDKSEYWNGIESLRDYVLIDQYAEHVEHYARQSDSRWLLTDLNGLDATLELPSVDCSLALADIYDRVDQLN